MRVERHGPHRTLGAIDVLVVCTANLCRSPMVRALLDRALADRGVPAHVHSAGLLFEGEPATDHGVAVMARRGLDTSTHRSRILSTALVRQADVIVCMEQRHVDEVVRLDPSAAGKASTLKALAGEPDGDIADPVGGSLADYERTARELEVLVGRAAQSLPGFVHEVLGASTSCTNAAEQAAAVAR